MQLSFYISYTKNIEELAKLVNDTFMNFSDNVTLKKNNSIYYLNNEYLSFRLDYDDIIGIDHTREESNVNVNHCIDITVFSKTVDIGLKLVFQVINNLISIVEGDVAFVDGESGTILLRSGGNLIVNSSWKENPDIYKWPIELIEGSYDEIKL
jgi:hypothetical protein